MQGTGVNWRHVLASHPELLRKFKPRFNEYIPIRPNAKQWVALLLNNVREVFYGGAAGGGKTDWLLAEALQYVDVPGYAALILRRTMTQLEMQDSIMSRSHLWLRNTDAIWQPKQKRWYFPKSGATLTFGYLETEQDKYRYDGPAFQFIGLDELTNFRESQYTFLASRLRKPPDMPVPLRLRSASNPGNIGHIWVKDRFVKSQSRECIFVPAKLEDNAQHVDVRSYEKTLEILDPVTRRQRRDGDWDADIEGAFFKREWFTQFVDAPPVKLHEARAWDMAASQGKGDYTAGARVGHDPDKLWYISNIIAGQYSSLTSRRVIKHAAEMDTTKIPIVLEQEPGSAGKTVAEDMVRYLSGWRVEAIPSIKKKEMRWMPFLSQCEAGNVVIVNGPWNVSFFEQLFAVPFAKHDDQVDAVTSAFNWLCANPKSRFGVDFLKGRTR